MTRPWRLVLLLPLLGIATARAADDPGAPARRTENVIFVTTDGLRWQDVFNGADGALMNKENGVVDVEALKTSFWREDIEDRRAALLPFFWSHMAKKGQVFGNVAAGSSARVTNGHNFSYPGYNEMMTGSADPRINSNNKTPNPNVSVLEWLNQRPGYQGRVAALGSWDVFSAILNRERSGLFVNAGWEPFGADKPNKEEKRLNALMKETPRVWADERPDVVTAAAAVEHLQSRRPRVMYVGLGDTDEYAHAGRYDLYLSAAYDFDSTLQQLWEAAQSDPEYRGKTTLIVTTDHGRGDATGGMWRHHGAKIKGAEQIWLAVLGPDTSALGVRESVAPVTQSQVAATLAALLGEDYHAAVPQSAPPIQDVLPGAAGPK